MSSPRRTVIVTGVSQGIGAGVVNAFVERGFNVVATSRKVTQSAEVAGSDRVALVDGDIGEPATAARVVETALSRSEMFSAKRPSPPASSLVFRACHSVRRSNWSHLRSEALT